MQQVPQEALIEIAEECAVRIMLHDTCNIKCHVNKVQLVDNDNELIAELACHILREIIRSRLNVLLFPQSDF